MSAEESDTSSTIVTISELIQNAFGDPDANTVHHKHIQAVLYILARQLRILERRVAVQLTPRQVQAQKSSSTLSVTEVKVHTMTESRKGSKTSIVSKKSTKGGKQPSKRDKTDTGSSEKTSSTSDKTTTVKGSSNKTSSYKTSSYGTSSDKTPTATKTTLDDDTSDADKTLKFGKKSTADKSFTAGKSSTADDISIPDATSAGKTSTVDDTSSDDATTAPDKASNATRKATTVSTATADDTSRSGKKSTAGTASAADDTSTGDKTSSAGKKSIAGTTPSAADTTSAEKKSTAGKKSTADKTSVSDGISVDRSDKKLSELKSRKSIATQGRKATTTTNAIDPQDYFRLLDEVEESRERELRVIRQRADSREEHERTPTPIASLDSFEATYEKLLVVERVPAEEAKARAARGRSTTRSASGPRLSVVTQAQFQELVTRVRQIQNKLAPIGTPDLPENAELMKELRKGASLTDAMAALQLSARLEATEKTLTNLLSLVTDLAKHGDDIEVLFGASDVKGKQGSPPKKSSAKSSKKNLDMIEIDVSPSNSIEILMPLAPLYSEVGRPDDDVKKLDNIVTYEELELELQTVYDTIMQKVNEKSTQSALSAENAMKLVTSLEKKIDVSINLGNKMDNLEHLVANYSEQINALDTGLSSQLTNYQEELTQMQHDLETGLENMAEVLANTGGDVTAVAELNAHFNDLQVDIDEAIQKQRELRNIQYNLSLDLDGLRAQIEMLRETKSDRDEVVDALRDKAGLGDLNGLISQQQFNAVRGDLEKRIANAYDKFNNQEIVWQKAIDDLLRELHEKADLVQVDSLRDEINYYLEMLRKKIKFIADIVGEPTAAALTRKLARDAACLSCAAPAHMNSEQLTTPILPAMRPPTIGAEAPKPKEDGDNGLCYQGYPVKHSIDPRAHACNRWCGGSHTLINAPKSRSPPSVIITPFNRKVKQERGTDGKLYAVDEQVPKIPCSQCIIPEPPAVSIHEEEEPSDVIPYIFPPISSVVPEANPSVQPLDLCFR